MDATVTNPTAPLPGTTMRGSPWRRFLGVVARPQSYRDLAYLLLGLPLGTLWFSVLVTGLSVAVSMLVVALLGIPLLVGLWYVSRAFANAERATANVLLGLRLAPQPMAAHERGNLWVRLRAMSRDRLRRRELGFLLLRFPVGVATFTAAVTALAVPLTVAYAPFAARYAGDEPFGDWALASTIEDMTGSPWSWLLVPFGLLLLVVSFHLMSALARAIGRWTVAWLGTNGPNDRVTRTGVPSSLGHSA
jgi:hypothetical protein